MGLTNMNLTGSGTAIQAVILDWAGTTIDFGSRAPASVFVEIFRRRGIDITEAEARGPMGRSKRDHIATVAALPRVAELWSQRFGHEPTDADVQSMYEDFLPLQKQTLAAHADVIPGVADAIDTLRGMGLRIGSTTGYTRELMEVVVPLAAQRGYSPDVVVCSDDVPAGRPAPWMNFLAAQQLGVYPLSSIVVVDDTEVGLEAGRHAGAITVGVTQTGNALGLSEQQLAAQDERSLQLRLTDIEQRFRAHGADHVIASVADLPALIRRLMPTTA